MKICGTNTIVPLLDTTTITQIVTVHITILKIFCIKMCIMEMLGNFATNLIYRFVPLAIDRFIPLKMDSDETPIMYFNIW
jgi:hypothetical protein